MDGSAIAIVVALAVVFFIVLIVNRRGSHTNTTRSSPPPPPQSRSATTQSPPATAARHAAPTPPAPSASAPSPAPIPEPSAGEEPTRGIGDRLRREGKEEAAAVGGENDSVIASSDEPAAFISYSPKEVAPDQWYDLLAYVYRQSALPQVEADAIGALGDQLKAFRRTVRPASANIAQDTTITITPRIDGFQFNPVSTQIGFYDAFNRADFKLRATTAAPGEVHEGMIVFTVEGIIVGEVPLFIDVTPDAAVLAPREKPALQPQTGKAYQAVFCSYSRKDLKIVERVERAYKILGFQYLRDLTTIRSGEDWDERLNHMIEQADIFQLFWSSNSATSNAVRKEWTKALTLAQSRPNFIRPVFWEDPLPPPPSELGKINFVYEPTLDD
jgi:hypothetical protein